MGITVSTSPQNISASVGETKIDVTVSGGIGPSGTGAGSVTWNDITGKPSTFTPSSHTHEYVEVASNTTYTNFLQTAGNLGGALSGIDSAISGKANASDFDQGVKTTDAPTFAGVTLPSDVEIGSSEQVFGLQSFAVTVDGETIMRAGAAWIGLARGLLFEGDFAAEAATNTRTALGLGTAALEDVEAFVVNTDTRLADARTPTAHKTSHATGGTDALTPADIGAASQSHAHGAITSDGKVGTTAGLVLKTGTSGAVEALAMGSAGQVLKINSGASGIEWGAAAADVSIDTTAADILSASSGSISADDPGADRLVFWDDSASKLTHLTVGSGLTISGTTITAAGAVTVASPSQITSNQNDYAGATADINRISSDAARDITGIAAGTDGQAILLINVGSFAITLKHQSTSSTAANRILVPWAADCVIPADGSAALVYDNTTARWRVI